MAQITIPVPEAKNWKTTLFGALAGVGAYMAAMTDPAWCQAVGKFLVVAAPVLMGFFAKDSNVTGGAIQQNTTAQ